MYSQYDIYSKKNRNGGEWRGVQDEWDKHVIDHEKSQVTYIICFVGRTQDELDELEIILMEEREAQQLRCTSV